MTKGIQDPQSALEFSIEMIPDGHFDAEETDRRRGLWQLWVILPDPLQNQDSYSDILAKIFDQPSEWVNEVLNLDVEPALT